MAGRHLRRVQEQLAPAQAAAAAEQRRSDAAADSDSDDVGSSDAEAAEPTARPGAPFNPFDLLTDDEEEPSGGSDSEEDGASSPKQQPAPAPRSSTKQPQQPLCGGKKGARQQQPQQRSKGKGKKGAHGGEEDLDALLQELAIAPPPDRPAAAVGAAPAARGAAAGSGRLPPLLGVDTKRIRGDDELRRIFGAGVVEAVDRAEGADRARGRAGGAAASARAAVRRRQLKRCMLVLPADHWPAVDSGLSMRAVGTAGDGSPLFAYAWSPNYAAAQRVFEQAQASYDPNAVAAVLHQFPYHVDSLLAMNELYRSMGEAQTADDMLARALFALEAAWPPGFDPAAGAVRLDVARPENRGLFVALFRHAQALSRRGCHASALEVTKLLLALDPEDPMGGLLLLDYLALRAGAHAYLERFVAEFDGSQALALLPNYAFSLPLARLRLEQAAAARGASASVDSSSTSASSGAPASGSGPASSAATSSTSSSGPASSATLLAQALLLHPLAFRELLAKLQAQGAAREAAWRDLAARKLFARASDHGSDSLGHLVSLFVERSHQLWRSGDVLAWLRAAATAAADVTDGRRRPQQQQPGQRAAAAAAGAAAAGAGLPGAELDPAAISIEGSAEDWACVARESFPPGSRNDYSHLRLADFSDTVNALPQEEMRAAMAAGAGGAPEGMDDAAALELLNDALAQQQLAAAAAAGGGGSGGRGGGAPAVGEQELRAANPLLMLLQSMLPWVNAGQAPDYAADDAAGGEGQQQWPPDAAP